MWFFFYICYFSCLCFVHFFYFIYYFGLQPIHPSISASKRECTKVTLPFVGLSLFNSNPCFHQSAKHISLFLFLFFFSSLKLSVKVTFGLHDFRSNTAWRETDKLQLLTCTVKYQQFVFISFSLNVHKKTSRGWKKMFLACLQRKTFYTKKRWSFDAASLFEPPLPFTSTTHVLPLPSPHPPSPALSPSFYRGGQCRYMQR